MWRIYRKTIFPRWHVNRQNPVDNKSQNPSHFKVSNSFLTDQKKKFNEDNQKKQHAHKQDRKFWDDPQYHFNYLRFSWLETASWLGTAAALCLNVHLKHIKYILNNDNHAPSACLFSRNVLSMPKYDSPGITSHVNIPSSSVAVVIKQPEKDTALNDAGSLNFDDLAILYHSSTQNKAGISSLSSNSRKAFRHFQSAARLGSSQAFYNLGLCYEMGKGTRMNHSRAAFCYRKAAMKGHGMASFNLAVYFFKGLGGLPVDPETAMLLVKQAAQKEVPEAQLYLGLEFLEQKNYSKAIIIFDILTKKNVPDGPFYLGLCYENGWGVPKNEKIAHNFYEKATLLGSAKATLRMKKYYEEKCKKEKLKSTEERNKLHLSSSLPELAVLKAITKDQKHIPVSSYLDLVPPFCNSNAVCFENSRMLSVMKVN